MRTPSPAPTFDLRGSHNVAQGSAEGFQASGNVAGSRSQERVPRVDDRPQQQMGERPQQAPSQSAADRLIVQAHELSRGAQTIDDYTRIIETCHRTRASQPSESVARYANELAGWALNRRGQIKADAGRLQEAMLDFDDAVRADAKCWRAIHNRGVLFAQSGHFEKAFDDFNRTIALNAEFAKAYSNRAALFVVAGDLLPALADYRRAIELDPNLAVAHRGRGRVCHLLGRLDEATVHYDAAVQLSPDDAYAMASRADLLTDVGRYSDAVRDYERSIELDPRSPHAYRGLAWLTATCPNGSVRNPTRAVELAELAIRLDEKQEAVDFDTLAAAQANAGNFPAAMQTLHKAIESAPDHERAVYQDRLVLYQHAKPFRIAPVREVAQVSYQSQ
jgi:tetratricopeptide (TPR) repeat protein